MRRLLSVVPEEYNATGLLFTLAAFASGDGGYPEGGSLGTANRMEKTFTDLGGTIRYKAKADKVEVRDGVAVGVRVLGELLPADAVIVTQDVLAAADQLFEAPPQDAWLLEMKRTIKHTACCFVSIGVKTVIPETPAFMLPEPIRFGSFSYPVIGFNNYADYPGYAPEDGMALTVFFGGDSYDFWAQARKEGRYESEKEAIGEQVLRALYEKYPQTEGKVEVIDVATPLTYERYTGASHGSWMSVMGKGEMRAAACPCVLEAVRGVYFAGHRTMAPGGQPAALLSGRTAAQMVCRRFDAVFR